MEKPESVSRSVRFPGELGLIVIDDLPEMIGWIKGGGGVTLFF
jgi:hypothetical protein